MIKDPDQLGYHFINHWYTFSYGNKVVVQNEHIEKI